MTMMPLLLLGGHVFTNANLHKNICYNTRRQHKQPVSDRKALDRFFSPVHLTGFFFPPHVVEQTPRIISRVSDTLPARSLSAYCVIFQDKLWDVCRVPQMHTVQKPMHTAPFLVHWSYVVFFCVFCFFFFSYCVFSVLHTSWSMDCDATVIPVCSCLLWPLV